MTSAVRHATALASAPLVSTLEIVIIIINFLFTSTLVHLVLDELLTLHTSRSARSHFCVTLIFYHLFSILQMSPMELPPPLLALCSLQRETCIAVSYAERSLHATSYEYRESSTSRNTALTVTPPRFLLPPPSPAHTLLNAYTTNLKQKNRDVYIFIHILRLLLNFSQPLSATHLAWMISAVLLGPAKPSAELASAPTTIKSAVGSRDHAQRSTGIWYYQEEIKMSLAIILQSRSQRKKKKARR